MLPFLIFGRVLNYSSWSLHHGATLAVTSHNRLACMRYFLSCAFTCVCACMTRHALHAFKQARPAECTRASSTCAVYLNILNTRASTALHAIPYGHCTPVPVQHSTCPELRSTTDLTRSVWDTTIGIAKYRNVTYWSYEASKR